MQTVGRRGIVYNDNVTKVNEIKTDTVEITLYKWSVDRWGLSTYGQPYTIKAHVNDTARLLQENEDLKRKLQYEAKNKHI
ncbi:MAG: hypothetical protein JXL97_16125 [Bacteroidales bacterium]|nr:hypothetical protein [Bacteroidales bacterium]